MCVSHYGWMIRMKKHGIWDIVMVLIMRGMNLWLNTYTDTKKVQIWSGCIRKNADVCTIDCEQIFQCEVVGDWDVSTRNMKYMSNHGQIDTRVLMI